MKKLKLMLSFMLIMFAFQAMAVVDPKVVLIQNQLVGFLQKEKYSNLSIDDSDNSVCFKKDKVQYWITFTTESPMLFTINRGGFNTMKDSTEEARKNDMLFAEQACNIVNGKYKMVKMFSEMKTNKVRFCLQAYAADAKSFIALFSTYMKAFDGAEDEFKDSYQTIKAKGIVNKKQEPKVRIVEQPIQPSKLKVDGFSIRCLDEANKVQSEYDKPMRSFNSQYIQTNITVTASEEGKYIIGARIYDPAGKMLLPSATSKFTYTKSFEVSKAKKKYVFEFDKFGKNEKGYWKPGTYRLEYWESDNKIYETTFSLL